MRDLIIERAKSSLLNFMTITSEAYNIRMTFKHYISNVILPLQKKFRVGSNRRSHIKEHILRELIDRKHELLNPIKEKKSASKKAKSKEKDKGEKPLSKEKQGQVRKITEEQLALATEIIYKILV